MIRIGLFIVQCFQLISYTYAKCSAWDFDPCWDVMKMECLWQVYMFLMRMIFKMTLYFRLDMNLWSGLFSVLGLFFFFLFFFASFLPIFFFLLFCLLFLFYSNFSSFCVFFFVLLLLFSFLLFPLTFPSSNFYSGFVSCIKVGRVINTIFYPVLRYTLSSPCSVAVFHQSQQWLCIQFCLSLWAFKLLLFL